jgi:hypothetical protein
MWNLNDESGGIGWGSPEAMGEIVARSDRLAAEFAGILVSYADPEGNYLEHEVLQRGVLWGLGRAAETRAGIMQNQWPLLKPFFLSTDPYHRGLAAWAAGNMGAGQLTSLLQDLAADENRLTLYRCPTIQNTTVGTLASKALIRMSQ